MRAKTLRFVTGKPRQTAVRQLALTDGLLIREVSPGWPSSRQSLTRLNSRRQPNGQRTAADRRRRSDLGRG